MILTTVFFSVVGTLPATSIYSMAGPLKGDWMKTRTNTVLQEDKSLPGLGRLKNSFGIERPFVDIFKKKTSQKWHQT